MKMTENYKILAKFIKDLSSETPNTETYLFVKDNIAKYQLGIDITSKALKNQMVEINTKLKFEDKEGNEKKSYFEIIYATIIRVNDEIKEKNMATWRRLRMSVAKKVVRRGFGAFSTSHRPNVSRVAWGLARLKAFAYLMKNDKPRDKKYITDNDLLPKEHPLYKED